MQRDRMRLLRVALGMLLALCGGAASAGESSLGVTARVLPRYPATARALAELPVPHGSQQMTSHTFGGSYRYGAELASALDFYRMEMPRRGFRLVRASSDGSQLVWDDTTTRIELELRSILGAVPETRIVIRASRSESWGAPGA